ncbi:MAG: acyltransferase [Bacteroidia bacterium]
MNSTSKVYFKGLNSLRFFAAFGVIITHVELLKSSFGYKSYWQNPIIFNLGGLGVYFFFVLSGFLITYLLLQENKISNNISIKNFYYRRILRIWPLYYLIVLTGFFVLPHFQSIHIGYLEANFNQYFNTNLWMYLLIMPNLAFSIFSAVPHIGQLWSIGVEEQFYIFWPWLIKKSKNILKTLIYFILILFLIKAFVVLMPTFMKVPDWYEPVKRFLAMSKLESMAIGGLGAYFLFFNKTTFFQWASNRYILIACVVSIPLLIYFTPEVIQDGIHIIYSFIFLIIIINIITSKRYNFLDNRIFNYLGNISYGIYMYHLMIIPIVLVIYKNYNKITNDVLENLIIYTSVFILTVLVSSLSYYGYEKPFIKLKKKFTKVNSGN